MMWDPAAIMASMSDMSIRVVIILLITVATVRLLTRQPARVRYIVWATAMVGILLVPGLAKLLPDWHVGILPNDLPSVGQTSEPHIDTSPTVTATVPRQRLEHSASVVERVPATPSLWERARSIDWRPGLLGLWAAGTLVLALSLGRGLWRARGLRRRAAKLDHDGWPALLAECSEQIRIVREAELAESAEISAPMTWGFLYPIILLPSAARGWSSERRRLVLLHELAHIKRNDWIVHLVSRLACIVYWFNPLVWAGAGRLNIEREKACDDDVIATGAKPSAYAAHLLDIARSVTSSSNIPAATLTMARSNQLEGRLVSMLNDMPRKSGHRVWLPALMLTPVIVALASLQPWSSVPVPSAVAFPVATEHESAVVQSDSHSGRYRFSRNDKDDVLVFEQSIEDLDMRVRIEGDVHFNEAGTEITRMERGAVVYIEAT